MTPLDERPERRSGERERRKRVDEPAAEARWEWDMNDMGRAGPDDRRTSAPREEGRFLRSHTTGES